METIAECRPPKTPFWHYPLMAVFFCAPAALIFIFLSIALELMNGFTTPKRVTYGLLLFSYLTVVLLMVFFLRWEQERWYWELTEDSLIWGRRKRNVIPLSFLMKIVPGRPMKRSVAAAGFGRGVDAEVRRIMASDFSLSFLLVFADGAMVPFHVHRCEGGTDLMRQIALRNTDRLDAYYRFSEEELKVLRFADWNRLTRPKHSRAGGMT